MIPDRPLAEQYRDLSDEAVLQILAEGKKHYLPEALTAALREAEDRGLDLAEVASLEGRRDQRTKLQRAVGFFLILNGYGQLLSVPVHVANLARSQTPLTLLDFAPLAVTSLGLPLLYIGAKYVLSWRFCVFWSAIIVMVVNLLAFMVPKFSTVEISGFALAVCTLLNLAVVWRLWDYGTGLERSAA